MPREMLRAGVTRRNVPSAKTIRRAEHGTVPHVRHRFGLAHFFGRELYAIWGPQERIAA
jgi:hypothetical protein